MGGVSKISDQFSLLVSLVALGGAIFLIIKTMLANLVERVREIGILKAVGWTGKDVQKQLMGEVLVQSLLGGVVGIVAGYLISYLLGFLSCKFPISTPWEVNLDASLCQRYGDCPRSFGLPGETSSGFHASSMRLRCFLWLGCLARYYGGGRRTYRCAATTKSAAQRTDGLFTKPSVFGRAEKSENQAENQNGKNCPCEQDVGQIDLFQKGNKSRRREGYAGEIHEGSPAEVR